MCEEYKKNKQEGPFFLSKCENKANKVCKKMEQFFLLDMAPVELDTSYNYVDDRTTQARVKIN